MEPSENVTLLRTTTSTRSKRQNKQFHRTMLWCLCISVLLFCLLVAFISLAVALSVNSELPSEPQARAVALLTQYPLIDGHNDLAWQIRISYQNQLQNVDLMSELSSNDSSWQTDIPRLRRGKVGAQFWSSYVPCSSQYSDATRVFIDQIDVIKQFVEKYPDSFMFATSVADIKTAFDRGLIASMIGVEGGHAIDSSLGTLRQLYSLGARYLTLTHTCDTPWSHSSVNETNIGLTDFGKSIVLEMNRLGMLVDISHVNPSTMRDTLAVSKAPVIFSHSSARALCDNARNVPDDVLHMLKSNQGVVMVTFVPSFINCTEPDKATLEEVADHIDHIKSLIGIDHIGISSDFDGISNGPSGLEDVSTFPSLFAELIIRGYTDDDIIKISRQNFIRVFKQVEQVRDDLVDSFPNNRLIEPQPNQRCRPDF